jgi:hypothetical protein
MYHHNSPWISGYRDNAGVDQSSLTSDIAAMVPLSPWLKRDEVKMKWCSRSTPAPNAATNAAGNVANNTANAAGTQQNVDANAGQNARAQPPLVQANHGESS